LNFVIVLVKIRVKVDHHRKIVRVIGEYQKKLDCPRCNQHMVPGYPNPNYAHVYVCNNCGIVVLDFKLKVNFQK